MPKHFVGAPSLRAPRSRTRRRWRAAGYVSDMSNMLGPEPGVWQTLGDVSTAAGVVVALIGVIVTLVLTLRSEGLTRKGQAIQQEQSEATAARSEAAAALTEEYTRRVVTALETMAEKDVATTGSSVQRTAGVSWSLTYRNGDTYLLTNVGTATAYDVSVSAHKTMLLRPPTAQNLEPSEALTFVAARSIATSDSTITAQWSEDGVGDTKIWKYPLPPRPRR